MIVRDNIGIAVDGGGIRGMMVARGLIELQKQLGVQRLIDDPRVKVVAGTSTGSIIAAMIASGFSAEQMVDLYKNLGPRVFSAPGRLRPFATNIPLLSKRKVPFRLFRLIEKSHFLKYALFPARYSFSPLEALIKERMAERARNGDLPNPNPTMEQLGEFLLKKKQRDLTVVITTADVVARRTLFVKTSLPEEESSEPDKQAAYSKARLAKMPLITAMMASSCIPTYWDPVEEIVPDIDDKPQQGFLVDGGVGNFGNPAAVVAWELCDNHRRKDLIPPERENARHNPYDPQNVTIFSFGTGYMSDDMYKKQYGTPPKWWALNWSTRAIDLFMNDANRQQSRGIVSQYRGIDLRRYQIELPMMIEADDVEALDTLERLGADMLAKHLIENRHALNPDKKLRYDPERIWNSDMERLVV